MRYCERCGAELGPDTRFCPACGLQAGAPPGTVIAPPPVPGAVPVATPRPGRLRSCATTLVLVVLAVVLLVIISAVRGPSKSATATNATVNASVPTAVEAPAASQTTTARSVPATSVPQVAAAPVVLHDYPANEVHSWMSGCTSGGGEDVCACILQKMRVEYTIQEFRAINEQYVKTGHFPPRIQQIVNACT